MKTKSQTSRVVDELQRPKGLRFDVPRVVNRKFELAALSDGAVLEIFDAIGDPGATAAMVSRALDSAGGADIAVRINSPGGDYFDGIAIFNLLCGYQGKVNVEILGVAASAASIIAMAGDTIAIARNAEIMIHRSSVLAIGNCDVMKEAADLLTRIDRAMAEVYADRTGKTVASMEKLMAAETWLRGQEAVDSGFADKVLNQDALAKPQTRALSPQSRVELETDLHRLGFARGAAQKIAAGGWHALAPPSKADLAALAVAIENSIDDLKRITR